MGRQRASEDTDTGIAIPQADRVPTMECNKQYGESSWQLVDDISRQGDTAMTNGSSGVAARPAVARTAKTGAACVQGVANTSHRPQYEYDERSW